MTQTSLAFRNLDADPRDPVEAWPIEAVRIALTRGSLTDWRRMLQSVIDDPWGPVARTIEYVLSYDRPYGTATLFEQGIARARAHAERDEKEAVATELKELLTTSGLTAREFADRLGTSASRMSTYLSGKVTPSASLMVRARRVASTNQPAAAPAPTN